jgi:hypothetical protein
MFSAYKITSQVSHKAYIGITAVGVDVRWREHVQESRRGKTGALHAAIRKYGSETFNVVHIASAVSREDLLLLEKLLIAQHGTRAPNGYNLTIGGDGCLGLRITRFTAHLHGSAI